MNESRSTANAAQRAGAGAARVIGVWGKLAPERRLAAIAAILLFLSLFLPWYQETVIATGSATKLQSASASLTGWGAFSFVEAAILLVAAGVLALLYQRAEGRAFHIPGGDGGVIMVAGLWTCVLVIWRIFDKQATTSHGQFATTFGIEWGIFVALAVAALLAYAGSRIRIAHVPEPPLPGEPVAPDEAPPRSSDAAPPPSRDAAPPPSRDAAPSPSSDAARRRPRPQLEAAAPRRARPVAVDSERRRARPPVAPDEAQTLRMSQPPATAARALPATPDEQLTIPLDGEE